MEVVALSYYEECRTKMDSFVSELEDEESRLLFDAKYQLFIDRDIDKFYDNLT